MPPENKSFSEYILLMHYPDKESINRDDVFEVLERCKKIESDQDNTRITLIINSTGGDIYSAYKIIKILRSKCKELNGIVLENANSAATLIFFGTDYFVMGPVSELGPLDLPMQEHPMIEGTIKDLSTLDGVRPLTYLFDVISIVALDHLGLDIRTEVGLSRKDSVKLALDYGVEYIKPIISKLDPLIISMCERSLKIAESYGNEFLWRYMFKDEPKSKKLAKDISYKFVWGFPSHDFVIDIENAKEMGLNVFNSKQVYYWDILWDYYVDRLKKEKNKVIILLNKKEFIENLKKKNLLKKSQNEL